MHNKLLLLEVRKEMFHNGQADIKMLYADNGSLLHEVTDVRVENDSNVVRLEGFIVNLVL